MEEKQNWFIRNWKLITMLFGAGGALVGGQQINEHYVKGEPTFFEQRSISQIDDRIKAHDTAILRLEDKLDRKLEQIDVKLDRIIDMQFRRTALTFEKRKENEGG